MTDPCVKYMASARKKPSNAGLAMHLPGGPWDLSAASPPPEIIKRMISCRRTGDFRFIGRALSAPRNIHKDHIDEIISVLGLSEKTQSMPNQLSGGQQQRVAIARALATKPSIILADEPTGNLDSKTSQDVLGLMKTSCTRFRQTLIMITHNEEIAQMADRIIRIEDGRVVMKGGALHE